MKLYTINIYGILLNDEIFNMENIIWKGSFLIKKMLFFPEFLVNFNLHL